MDMKMYCMKHLQFMYVTILTEIQV
jgi:hypothetical protein